jgi:hypothetical protein
MSSRPSQVRAVSAASGTRVPVARPPVDFAPVPLPELAPSPWNWKLWTPEARQGWIGSVGLHGLLLLVLFCWWFAPRSKAPVAFDSRLAGSPNGVFEAEALTGGLNTALAMPAAPLEIPQSTAPSLTQMELTPSEPDPRFGPNKTPTGGGGGPNDNPVAGDGDGFGLARFGEGGELVQGVEVKVGDPQFTLIWDKDGVDLDLHVEEPGGKEIFWEEPKGARGGELDVDNTKGFGPENVYWLVEAKGPGSEKIKGPGPAGTYRWFVVYYGGFGGVPKPTHWQVRVKHDGKVTVYHGKFRALNERSKIYTLKVDPSSAKPPASASADSP